MAIPLTYNLRSLQVRWTSTFMTVLGVGAVAGVLVALLALAAGITRVARETGDPLNLIVLRDGSQTETNSSVATEALNVMRNLPGVARGPEGQPLITGDLFTIMILPRRGAQSEEAIANVAIRGVREAAIPLRSRVRLVEGRWFNPGAAELTVARALVERFAVLELGKAVKIGNKQFTVVGVFDAVGTAFNSEAWADVTDLQTAFNRPGYSSVTLRVEHAGLVEGLIDTIRNDPRLQLKAQIEPEYYARQNELQTQAIQGSGTFVAILMGIGAVFAAMNTMFAAVAVRGREIATMRALGFRRWQILLSFLMESVALGLIGGLLGCLPAPLINGITTGTVNWDTFTEMTFAFQVTPAILLTGILFAGALGFVGGLLPAWRAARRPITLALREG